MPLFSSHRHHNGGHICATHGVNCSLGPVKAGLDLPLASDSALHLMPLSRSSSHRSPSVMEQAGAQVGATVGRTQSLRNSAQLTSSSTAHDLIMAIADLERTITATNPRAEPYMRKVSADGLPPVKLYDLARDGPVPLRINKMKQVTRVIDGHRAADNERTKMLTSVHGATETKTRLEPDSDRPSSIWRKLSSRRKYEFAAWRSAVGGQRATA